MESRKREKIKKGDHKINKYRNIKTEIDNIVFHSKKEANRYLELKLLLQAKEIKELKLQPKFNLLDPFIKEGKKYRGVSYIADFMYFDCNKEKYIVEDVKGFITKEFKIKEKLFNSKYPYQLILI